MSSRDPARLTEARSDKRRHKRIALMLPARFMLPDQSEHAAHVLNISAGGIALATETKPAVGSTVIVYVKDIGRLEGQIVRHLPTGFAAHFDTRQVQHDRVVDKITWEMNRRLLQPIDARAHERQPGPEDAPARLILPNGRTLTCRVLDMSFGGVSIAIEPKPRIGERVVVGRMQGRVVRHHATGIGVAFDEIHTHWGSLAQSLR